MPGARGGRAAQPARSRVQAHSPGRSRTPQRWELLPGSSPQSRGWLGAARAAPHTGDPAQGPCSGQARHKRPGAIGNAGGTASAVTARAGGQRSRLPRTRAPGQAAPGRLGRAGPGPPRGAVGAYGGWRPLQAAAGRTPGASAAGAAARRSQCHGVRRRARGRAGARPIPAARPPHAALTLERRRRIEELSRSSRQRLLQSRDRMFSKFTSILQHAVEAVRPPAGPATPRRGCEPGPAAERAPRGAAARSGRPGPARSLSAVPRACRLPRGSLPGPAALPSGVSAGSRGPAGPGSPVPRGREAEAGLPAQAAASGGPERCPPSCPSAGRGCREGGSGCSRGSAAGPAGAARGCPGKALPSRPGGCAGPEGGPGPAVLAAFCTATEKGAEFSRLMGIFFLSWAAHNGSRCL